MGVYILDPETGHYKKVPGVSEEEAIRRYKKSPKEYEEWVERQALRKGVIKRRRHRVELPPVVKPEEHLKILEKEIEKAPESTRKVWIRTLSHPKEGTVQYIKTPHGYARLKFEGGRWRYYPPSSKIYTHVVSFSIDETTMPPEESKVGIKKGVGKESPSPLTSLQTTIERQRLYPFQETHIPLPEQVQETEKIVTQPLLEYERLKALQEYGELPSHKKALVSTRIFLRKAFSPEMFKFLAYTTTRDKKKLEKQFSKWLLEEKELEKKPYLKRVAHAELETFTEGVGVLPTLPLIGKGVQALPTIAKAGIVTLGGASLVSYLGEPAYRGAWGEVGARIGSLTLISVPEILTSLYYKIPRPKLVRELVTPERKVPVRTHWRRIGGKDVLVRSHYRTLRPAVYRTKLIFEKPPSNILYEAKIGYKTTRVIEAQKLSKEEIYFLAQKKTQPIYAYFKEKPIRILPEEAQFLRLKQSMIVLRGGQKGLILGKVSQGYVVYNLFTGKYEIIPEKTITKLIPGLKLTKSSPGSLMRVEKEYLILAGRKPKLEELFPSYLRFMKGKGGRPVLAELAKYYEELYWKELSQKLAKEIQASLTQPKVKVVSTSKKPIALSYRAIKRSTWNPYRLVPSSLIEIGYESIVTPSPKVVRETQAFFSRVGTPYPKEASRVILKKPKITPVEFRSVLLDLIEAEKLKAKLPLVEFVKGKLRKRLKQEQREKLRSGLKLETLLKLRKKTEFKEFLSELIFSKMRERLRSRVITKTKLQYRVLPPEIPYPVITEPGIRLPPTPSFDLRTSRSKLKELYREWFYFERKHRLGSLIRLLGLRLPKRVRRLITW